MEPGKKMLIDRSLEQSTKIAELRAEIRKLQERELKLIALENAGVDNWEGYDRAMDLWREYEWEDQEEPQ